MQRQSMESNREDESLYGPSILKNAFLAWHTKKLLKGAYDSPGVVGQPPETEREQKGSSGIDSGVSPRA